MKHARKTALVTSVFTCAALFSFGWTEQGGISLSIESAQARVGRPLTPVSVAGVARRQNRRAGYGYGYGAGVAGAAAVGTAAAVAATSPSQGWGTGPYYGGRPYYGGAFSGTYDARASYGGPWGGVSSSDRDLYFKNLHNSGYNPKNNYNANGTIKG